VQHVHQIAPAQTLVDAQDLVLLVETTPELLETFLGLGLPVALNRALTARELTTELAVRRQREVAVSEVRGCVRVLKRRVAGETASDWVAGQIDIGTDTS
jgi:hypothetical protein